jgi:hypothetical protein
LYDCVIIYDGVLLFAFRNGFQRLDKIKDSNRQSKQLEELTGRMRECKRYAIQFLISVHVFSRNGGFEYFICIACYCFLLPTKKFIEKVNFGT